MGDTVVEKMGYIQFLIYLAIILFGIATTWAAYGARINELERCATSSSKDHDALISLNTKLDILILNTGEIQKDLKEHLTKK